MDILFENESLVVCVKPVGLDSETEMPQALTRQLGGAFYPVHRLDRAVGGLMVYGRTTYATGILSRAIQNGLMVKEYVALTTGTPPENGVFFDLLWKDSKRNKVFVVHRMRTGVKEAKLEYTRLTQSDPALVRVRLHTGRTHQIRVQFASRGYPLVGDHKYGARDKFPHPMLFSCKLSFPWDGDLLTFDYLPPWAESPGSP